MTGSALAVQRRPGTGDVPEPDPRDGARAVATGDLGNATSLGVALPPGPKGRPEGIGTRVQAMTRIRRAWLAALPGRCARSLQATAKGERAAIGRNRPAPFRRRRLQTRPADVKALADPRTVRNRRFRDRKASPGRVTAAGRQPPGCTCAPKPPAHHCGAVNCAVTGASAITSTSSLESLAKARQSATSASLSNGPCA